MENKLIEGQITFYLTLFCAKNTLISLQWYDFPCVYADVLKPILPFCTDHTVLVMVRKQVKDRLRTDRLKKLRNILRPAAVLRIKLNITKRSYIVNYIFRLCYERRT